MADFGISTDRDRLDLDLIHAFHSAEAYWARDRPREVTERAIAGSLCFGAYGADDGQIGFARLVTDHATFGYLADVFVVGSARGRGVGRALVEAVLAHPATRGLRRLVLVTEDAHGLYERYGFAPLDDAARWMGIRHVP